MLLFLFSSLTPLQEMEELEHDFDSSMSAGGRSSPDLIVDYISASWSSADAGDSKSVSVRIENQGDASSGSFRWGLYLSTDTSITTSDTHLDDWSQSSISSGSSRSTSKSITIPTTIPGARYYVGMIVDINNQVSESDENNNDDYDSGRVTINEAPDLTGRSCSTPSTGVVGDYLDSSISLSIENDPGGSYIASSGAFDWGMFLSSDSTITTSDTQVGSDQYKSSISGGSYSSDTLSSSNRIPSSLSGGTYHWGFIVDINSDVDEQDETNNIYYCGQITIEDDDADLEADSVGTSSSSAVMGDTITVSYRINNIGHDYSGSFHWELYLSTDQTITTNDVLVDEFSVSSISANNYRSGYEYNVQIPTTITAGYYYLGMIADNRDAVDELDETNNVAYDSTRIDIEEQADLEATTLSGPAQDRPDNKSAFHGRLRTMEMTQLVPSIGECTCQAIPQSPAVIHRLEVNSMRLTSMEEVLAVGRSMITSQAVWERGHIIGESSSIPPPWSMKEMRPTMSSLETVSHSLNLIMI